MLSDQTRMKDLCKFLLCLIFAIFFGCASVTSVQNIRQIENNAETSFNEKITLMTFNIRAGGGVKNPGMSPKSLMATKENLIKIVDAIKSVDPDVVGLQEVRGFNQAQFIAEKLNMNFTYSTHGSQSWWGLAVLSKYKIINTKSKLVNSGGYYGDRIALMCNVDLDEKNATIINVHYALENYKGQVRATMKFLDHAKERVILLGDMNLVISDPEIKPIREILLSSFQAANINRPALDKYDGNIYTRDLGIDHIFIDPESFEVIFDGYVPESHWSASDHRAWFAIVKFGNHKRLIEIYRAQQKEKLPLLIAKLKDENDNTRRQAVSELGNFDYVAKNAIPELIKILKSDKNPSVRAEAAKTLGMIGLQTEAQNIVPALQEAMNEDIHDSVRIKALRALGEINRWQSE